MRARRLAVLALLALFALLVSASVAVAQDEEAPPAEPAATEEPVEPEPEPYSPYAGSAQELADAHVHVGLRTIATSAGGRPFELIEVTNPDAAQPAEWVALVVAGLHGRRPEGESRLAVAIAAWLAERAEDLPAETAVQVLAVANPDARAAGWSRAGNDTPVDEDRDGDLDEDGPDDVNGDGRITWMRYPDPTGQLSVPADEEALAAPVWAEPGKGLPRTHRVVLEGRDDDGDGVWNEDGAGGVDLSRNFPWQFEEHAIGPGRWAASERATKRLMDHLLADERIALVLEIGGADTAVKNPGWTKDAWPKLPDDDTALMDTLRDLLDETKRADALAGKPHAPGRGSLGATLVHQLGRIWIGRAPLGRSGPVWPDADATWPESEAILWTPAEGPGLPPGAEVGTITVSDPDSSEIELPEDEGHDLGAFLLAAAKGRADVHFTGTAAEGPSGVLRLRTRLVNRGRLPTHTARGAKMRGRRPLNVRVVLPDGARLLAGKPHVQIERLGPGASSDELTWVIAGASGGTVRIEVTGPDTGTDVLEERIP